MKKRLCIAVLALFLEALCALGQSVPALDTFTSPDGTFQFVYPQTYELLIGERLLKTTQGAGAALPVCDFSTALACVMYPPEVRENTRFEGAGFSVDAVPVVKTESECLMYSDQSGRAPDTNLQLTSITINDHVFRHVSTKKKLPGHMQAADYYRTFVQQKCYELRIHVSVSDDSPAPKSLSESLGDAKADRAREALRLILSSFVFKR